jgi:hypothetical protein
VFLPKGIAEKEMYSDRSRLTVAEYMQLLDPPAIQAANLIWDEEDLARQADARRQYLDREKRVEKWFNIISADLEKKKKVEFGDYFFKMLNAENDLEAAVKEATLVLKEFSGKQGFEVIVKEEFALDPKQPNVGLWKMQIKSTVS